MVLWFFLVSIVLPVSQAFSFIDIQRFCAQNNCQEFSKQRGWSLLQHLVPQEEVSNPRLQDVSSFVPTTQHLRTKPLGMALSHQYKREGENADKNPFPLFSGMFRKRQDEAAKRRPYPLFSSIYMTNKLNEEHPEMMLQKRSYPMFSTIYMKNKLRNGNPDTAGQKRSYPLFSRIYMNKQFRNDDIQDNVAQKRSYPMFSTLFMNKKLRNEDKRSYPMFSTLFMNKKLNNENLDDEITAHKRGFTSHEEQFLPYLQHDDEIKASSLNYEDDELSQEDISRNTGNLRL